MSDTIEKTLKIKEIVDVKDAIHGIEEIQGALSKLQLKPDIKAGFDKIFQDIERQAEKANTAMATGFKNKGDVKRYTEALHQIDNAYNTIIFRLEKLKTQKDIKFNFDTEEVKSIKSDLENLTKVAEQAATQLEAAGKALGKSAKITDIDNRRAKGAKGGQWKEIIDNLNPEDLDKAIKKVEELREKADKSLSENKSVTYWKSVKADLNEIQKEIDNYNTALQAQSDAQDKVTKKTEELDAAMHNVGSELDLASNAAKSGSKEFDNYAKSGAEAANSTQQLNSELEHFKGKAAYFFGLSNAINLFKRSLRSAYDTVKDLDAVMTETAVVTNFDVGDMWSQLPEYTQRANELGVTIHDTYEAATLFYQQGLKTNEVMQISNETLKMARIAGLDAATASDRMTNALRGFNMELDKISAQRVNDVYSKLAAITASNTDEISTAMTKVASLAHNANMEFETTAAFLAQIIESTRESAETAGTALKTVVARFSEVKKLYSKGELMGQDEEGEEIDVNKVSTALRSAGINLNEYLTGAKGLDDIFIELADKWDSLDQVQQRYIATMAAGSRQQSRFIALMSNYKRTAELVSAANNANGASQEQYNKTLESLQTKLARLKNAWNEFILGLTNSDVIKGAVDMLTALVTAINNLIKTISGKNSAAKMITTFFTAFTAFKIGQKAFGGTEVGKFFSGLTQIAGTQGKKGAVEYAKNFYLKLANKIADFQGGGGIAGAFERGIGGQFKETAKGLFQYLKPTKSAVVETDIDQFYKKLFDSKDFNLDVPEGAIDRFVGITNEKLEEGILTTDQLNTALRECGQTIQITDENAADFGITLSENDEITGKGAIGLKQYAAGAAVLGGIMVAAGNALEATEGPLKVFGTTLKVVGAGLLTFGTIMSVYLPLQAQLMAKGVTGAIVSIPIIGWIAGVISALVALGVALHSFSKNYSAEAKLERAAEAAEKAADAAEEARDAFNELNEAWSKLDDKYEAIENATQGTIEWKNAVKELNDQVLELMNTYSEVQIKRNEDGTLEIKNRKEITDKMQDRALTTEGAARISKIRQYEASQNVRKKDLKLNAGNYDIAFTELTDEFINSGKIEELAGKAPEEIERLLNEIYEKHDVYGTIAAANKEQALAVQEFAKNYLNDQNAINSQLQALGSTALQKAEISGDLQKYANTFLSNDYLNNLIQKNRDSYKFAGKEQYAEHEGYNSWKDYVNDHQEDKDATDTELQDRLASADALEEATDQIRLFTNKLKELNSAEKTLFEQQNGGALTKGQAETLSKYNEGQKLALYTNAGGDAVFGKGGFDKFFKKWFETAVGEAVSNFNTEKKYGEKFSSILSEELTKGLDSNTFKSFTENLFSVFAASGADGVKEIQDSISKMVKPEQRKAFIEALNKIDWTSSNSIRTLSNLATQYGISENALEDFEQKIIKLNNAVAKVDLAKVTNQLKSLLGLGKKIQSGTQGRNFSEEQKNQLIEAGIDSSKFEYNIETGDYNYTGILQDILEAVNKVADETFDTKQIEKDIASGKAAREVSSGGLPANNEDKMAFIRDYVLKAGENSKISTDMLALARDEASKGKYTTADKLIKIIENESGALETNENLLKEHKLNKDAMQKQLNTGTQNAFAANNGDEGAKKALLAQVSNSDIPEELRQRLLTGMTSDNMADLGGRGHKQWTEMAGSLTDTFNKAKGAGFKPEELEAYANSLRQINGLEKEREDILYSLALAEMNYQTGQQSLYDSYDSWSKLIQKNGGIVPDGSIEQGKIFNKLNEDLKQMLNLSEKLPDSFLKSKDNVDLLKKAIKGDKEAVAKLRAEAAKVQVGSLSKNNFSPTVDKTGLENAIDDLAKEMPDLEIGATLDESKAGAALKNLVNNANMSASQIENLFKSLGWDPKIEWVEAEYSDVQKTAQNGYIEQPDGHGGVTKVKLQGEDEYETGHKFYVPKIGNNTKFTAPKPPKKNPTTKKKGKGGGGGKKSAKKERWENPYDELYNLQEKINEALRKREALERRYQKLLKQEQSTLKEVRAAYTDQIKHLQTEASLQKQLAAGRLNQINKLGKDTYVTSKGKVKTFEQMGVTKYAKYNKETGEIQIDWAGINKLEGTKHVETGKAVEAYISKLEELVKGYEDTRDALWDIEDKVEDLRQQVIETYLSFEDRVLDALVTQYQRQIDSYQAMSDAIDKVNDEVLKSLREQIDLSRQIRDNTKKEEDISKKENRLAYLRRDTSGANDLEILSLEKELKEAREDYGDNLVDQTIDKLQKDADQASEQRQRQIEIMQTQLDIMQKNGTLWNEAHKFYTDAVEKLKLIEDNEEFKTQFTLTDLAKLLAKSEDTQGLSNAGYVNWLRSVLEEFKGAVQGKDELEDKYNIDVDNDGRIDTTNTQKIIDEIVNGGTTTGSSVTTNFEDSGKRNHGIAVGAKLGGYGWSSNTTQLEKQLKDKGFNENDIREILEIFKVVNKTNWKKMWPNLKLSDYSIDKFARGGLADYTGPAWLDGTKTNPELVLNAQDTRNFIALKDILSSLMNTQGASTKTSSGDNYFDINITADIGSDYDVDKLANRIKKQIFEDSQYRNVNTINYLR